MKDIRSRGGKERPLVEDCLILDLAWLMRLAPIREGQVGNGEVNWSIDGCDVGSLRFQLDMREVENARLILNFDMPNRHSNEKAWRQIIALSALPQHFGGLRWWLHCPVTGERVRTLFMPPNGDRFASRKAWGLNYRVERLSRFDRPFEKLFREQRKLRGLSGLNEVIERPKGMWKRTFARHVARIEQHDIACAEKIAALISKA